MLFRIKQILFWLAYRVDQMVPRVLSIWLRNRCWPWRPVLDAVELHLADRCNMNCTGCSHFSPFAASWFPATDALVEDLVALKSRFAGGIRHINLLGGEPLLNREIDVILKRVRAVVPEACITVVTNGILLIKSDDLSHRFLSACREVGARVKVTLYPPMFPHREQLVKMFADAHVALRIEEGGEFWARSVPNGTASIKRAFRFCRKHMYCPYLREGRLYACAQAFHIRDLARVEQLEGYYTVMSMAQRPETLGLDIHDATLTGRRILEFLMTPTPVCRYCSDSFRRMSWSSGSLNPQDWRR